MNPLFFPRASGLGQTRLRTRYASFTFSPKNYRYKDAEYISPDMPNGAVSEALNCLPVRIKQSVSPLSHKDWLLTVKVGFNESLLKNIRFASLDHSYLRLSSLPPLHLLSLSYIYMCTSTHIYTCTHIFTCTHIYTCTHTIQFVFLLIPFSFKMKITSRFS